MTILAVETPMGTMGTWLFVLGFLALAPFLFTLITSFAKLVIVGGIIRQAIGTPQIPPTMVITGLALILTVHIMSPVAEDAYLRWERIQTDRAAAGGGEGESAAENEASIDFVRDIVEATGPPLHEFLERHANPRNVVLFERLQARLRSAHGRPGTEPGEAIFADQPELQGYVDDAIVLVPAFVLTELTEAFQIGFLIFIPFLVIDLVVSNILLAMGMHMLSPTTISLPFKLLLFVLVDGWSIILQGVVLGYA